MSYRTEPVQQPFADAPERLARFGLARAPWVMLVTGAAAVAAGGVLMLDGGPDERHHLAGWLLSSIVAFAGVAWYRRAALRREFLIGAPSARLQDGLAWAILVVGFALAVVHAWAVARGWVG